MSEPALYCHLSPGWCISGSVPNRLIHSSGVCGVRGSGGPMTSCNSLTALTIGNGGSKVGSTIMPKPMRNVSRSSTVLKRVDGPLDETVPADRPITVEDLLTFRMGFGMIVEPTFDPQV